MQLPGKQGTSAQPQYVKHQHGSTGKKTKDTLAQCAPHARPVAAQAASHGLPVPLGGPHRPTRPEGCQVSGLLTQLQILGPDLVRVGPRAAPACLLQLVLASAQQQGCSALAGTVVPAAQPAAPQLVSNTSSAVQ